jgi:hypothetical protein
LELLEVREFWRVVEAEHGDTEEETTDDCSSALSYTVIYG